jgi:hypothetical protein
MEVHLHVFLTSLLNEDGWSPSAAALSLGEPRSPGNYRKVGWTDPYNDLEAAEKIPRFLGRPAHILVQ